MPDEDLIATTTKEPAAPVVLPSWLPVNPNVPAGVVGGSTRDIVKSAAPPVPQGPQAPQGQGPSPDFKEQLQGVQQQLVLRMLGDIMNLPAAQAGDAAQRQAAIAEANARHNKIAQLYGSVANSPLPPVYEPKRAQFPEAPKAKYRPPEMAVAQPLSLLAVLGGLFAKGSSTASLNALASAMEGQKKQDQIEFNNSLQTFEAEMEKAVSAAHEEHTMFKEAWENRTSTWNERISRMNMLVAQYQNQGMGHAVSSGNVTAIDQRLQAYGMALGAIDKIMKETGGLRTSTMQQAMAGAAQQAMRDGIQLKDGTMFTPNLAEAWSYARDPNKFLAARAGGDKGRGIKKGEPGYSWGQLPPMLHNVIEAFPDVATKFKSENYTIGQAEIGRLEAAHSVLKENDAVSKYIADNPDAVGLLPTILNSVKSTVATQPAIAWEEGGWGQAQRIGSQAGDVVAGDIMSKKGTRLPDGRILTPQRAEKAAILAKMLIQTGLSDAAQMSATGRGGTIYLDKLMTERIYNQLTNAYTLLEFIRNRNQPAVQRWKSGVDPAIDLGSPNLDPAYRTDLIRPGYFEMLLAKAYPDAAGHAIPAEAIEQLMNNPGTRDDFDAHFGQGRTRPSVRVLGE